MEPKLVARLTILHRGSVQKVKAHQSDKRHH
jgi:hypothetical protein